MRGGRRGPSFGSSDAAEKRNDIGSVPCNCHFESSVTIAAALGVRCTVAKRTRAQATAAPVPQRQVSPGFNKKTTRIEIHSSKVQCSGSKTEKH